MAVSRSESWTADQTKEFIEAVLSEKDRALEMADDEREKAASALRSEQQRREDQAGKERDKAAENLRIELARAINEGDDRLREHISNQIMQINAALVSSEKLEQERLARVDQALRAVEEQQRVLRDAAVVSQTKFEHSVEQRFAQVNEFRSALDDLSKAMATRRELEAVQAANLVKQDDTSTALSELRSRLDIGPAGLGSLRSEFDRSAGSLLGVREQRDEHRAGLTATQGMVATAIAILILIVGIYSAVHLSSKSTPPPTTVTVTTP